MTPVEIIALIFSILILLKIILFNAFQKPILNLVNQLIKRIQNFTIIYVIIAIILGYYIFQELNIIQVAAVTLFAAILIDISLIPFYKPLMNNINAILKSRYMWIFNVMWGIFAVLTLYALYNIYF